MLRRRPRFYNFFCRSETFRHASFLRFSTRPPLSSFSSTGNWRFPISITTSYSPPSIRSKAKLRYALMGVHIQNTMKQLLLYQLGILDWLKVSGSTLEHLFDRHCVSSAQREKLLASDRFRRMTHEQYSVINSDIGVGEYLKINAFAGTGKTTTLIAYTEARPHKRFLYLAYNKAIQQDAERRYLLRKSLSLRQRC